MGNNFNLPEFKKMQPSKCLFIIFFYCYQLNHFCCFLFTCLSKGSKSSFDRSEEPSLIKIKCFPI